MNSPRNDATQSGALPPGWRWVRLKFLARVQTGMAKGKELQGVETIEVPYLRVANVQDGYLDLDDVATMPVPVNDLDRYRLQAGDVLMNEGGDFDKLGRGHVWHGQIDPCIHQNHVFAVRPHGVLPEWLNAYAGSAPAQFFFMGRAKQSTNLASISSSNLMELPVPVPPEQEQRRRLEFLDRETARIDALVEKKTRFIELLREKRQALVVGAVTRGLGPSVSMKASGIEWIGRIPAHWARCKLSLRYTVDLGKMLDEKRITGEHPMPYLRNQDVQWSSINAEGLPLMDISPGELERYSVQFGDLLVCEGGDVGRAAIWHGDNGVVAYQKALHRLRPRDVNRDCSEYLKLVLVAAKAAGAFEEGDDKATISHLPAEKFRQFVFAFPPLGEQRQIVAFVAAKSNSLVKLVAKVSCSIDLLRERRAALITAAVTGQIDLREPA